MFNHIRSRVLYFLPEMVGVAGHVNERHDDGCDLNANGDDIENLEESAPYDRHGCGGEHDFQDAWKPID